ncbi:hypothetical protein AO715_01080 [Xanthomonas sp. Mitacek01]|nr:hypothetical protein AO715_01080 [Xanthomonas sp. Mitacek01]
MFVRNFPEVSGIDAPWLSTFVFSGAAQERAAIRQSELDLAPDVRDSAQALLLVSAWEVVNLTEADSADADAVLRQLQAARAAPDTPDQLAVYTLTTAVILEAATRAAQSGDAARAALGDQVRADFIATAGVDLAGLQIGKAGFIRATDASRTPVDD